MRVVLVRADGAIRGEAECPPGERVLDALDDARVGFSFGCRSGTCGLCLVRVRAGAEHLAAPDGIERRALDELGAAADERLACRAVAAAPDGEVVLEPSASPASPRGG